MTYRKEGARELMFVWLLSKEVGSVTPHPRPPSTLTYHANIHRQF